MWYTRGELLSCMFKKHFKFFKKTWFALSALLLSAPLIVEAQSGKYGLTQSGESAGYGDRADIYPIMQTIITAALSILAILFFAFALYAGVRWMTAHGNDKHVEKAKETLKGSVIGLAITVSAYAIARFVLSRLGG